ncbi:MAG TPA: hypothetical protein VFC68_07015 [Treponemataceae bacterium]|nr:hypothetical protein [Treponemataceae bacterium]
MKKCFFCILVAIVVSNSLLAQVLVDPNSKFYKDVQIWEVKNLLSNVPNTRPYSNIVISNILDTVIEQGSAIDKQKALAWQASIQNKDLNVFTKGTYATKISNDQNNIYNVHFGVCGDIEIIQNVAFSYDIGTVVQNNSLDKVLPATFSNPYDDSGDVAKIGSLESVINVNTTFSYDTKHLSLHGGISRFSYGPFYDTSIVIAPDTYHTGNITARLYKGSFSYQQSLFALTASDNRGDASAGFAPGKLMALHEIAYTPFSWIKVAYFETILWKDRFEFSYLLPISYMVGQSLGGFEDNIQMGLTAQIMPYKGLLWNNQIYVDDISANDILKLDFDTKIIAAFQSQLAWSPLTSFNKENSFCNLLTLNFMFVNAYMYSHKPTDTDDYNYVNLTTKGEQLSTEIKPNSYSLTLKAELEPVFNVSLAPFISLTQHGNVNETITTEEAIQYLSSKKGAYTTDGSAFNTPFVDKKYIAAYLDDWFFLEQDHIETRLQAGFDSVFDIALGAQAKRRGSISVNASYIFEYVHNCMDEAGDMFPGKVSSPDPDDVIASKQAWVDRLYNAYNNYLRISVKYQY